MRVNLPALLLSLAIVGGSGALALREYVLPAIGGTHASGDEGGLRRGAETVECRQERQDGKARYVFKPPCAGQAPSPDRHRLVVRNAGGRNGVGLVRARDGASLADLGVLDDGTAFTIGWSPRSDWFFANQALPSGGERMRLFKLVGDTALEHPALADEARRILAARHPCVVGGDIRVTAEQWNAEGTRLALTAEGRAPGCGLVGGALVRRLSMVGDVASGRVDPASVRAFVPGPVLPL